MAVIVDGVGAAAEGAAGAGAAVGDAAAGCAGRGGCDGAGDPPDACVATDSTIACSCAPAVWICRVTVLPGGSGTVVLRPSRPLGVCSRVSPFGLRSTTVPVRKVPTATCDRVEGSCVSSAETAGPCVSDVGVMPELGVPIRVMMCRRQSDGGVSACA